MTRLATLLALLALAAAAGAQARPIAGLVVDAAGDPQPGAAVELRCFARPELPATIGASLEDAVQRAFVRSDAAGRFRFTPPTAATYLVRAELEDRASATAFPIVAGDFVRLELGPELAVRGTVRGAEGPLAEALVELVDVDDAAAWRRAVYRYPEVPVRTRTAVDGRFALRLERGYLTHPIWFPLRGPVAVAGARQGGLLDGDAPDSGPPEALRPGVDPGDLLLSATAASIPITVTDRRGAPLPGARILSTRLPSFVRTTGADGRAAIPRWLPACWILAADHAATPLRIDPERQDRAEVRLESAGRVMVGAVRLAAVPLADARVLVSIPALSGPPLEWLQSTSASGQLDVRGIPDGAEAHLLVEVEGRFRPLLRATGPSLAVAAVDLPPQIVVAGQVLDPSGVPASHARVALRVEGWPPWITWSDRAGRFRFELALPGDGAIELAAQADGVGVVRRAGLGRGELLDGVELRLAAGEPILGRVVDESGKPVVGAWVTMIWSSANRPPVPGPDEMFNAHVVLTDGDGRFGLAFGVGGGEGPAVMVYALRDGERWVGTAQRGEDGAGELRVELRRERR